MESGQDGLYSKSTILLINIIIKYLQQILEISEGVGVQLADVDRLKSLFLIGLKYQPEIFPALLL